MPPLLWLPQYSFSPHLPSLLPLFSLLLPPSLIPLLRDSSSSSYIPKIRETLFLGLLTWSLVPLLWQSVLHVFTAVIYVRVHLHSLLEFLTYSI